ncbi:Hypothetical predicted protein, partial [Argonauta hians]
SSHNSCSSSNNNNNNNNILNSRGQSTMSTPTTPPSLTPLPPSLAPPPSLTPPTPTPTPSLTPPTPSLTPLPTTPPPSLAPPTPPAPAVPPPVPSSPPPSSSPQQEPPDFYRDTYVRYLGYANEVGEAFRALVPVNAVRFSYVVACGYVAADANHKGERAAQKSDQSSSATKKRLIAMADTVVWQGLASVAIPGFTINRLCAGTNYLLKKSSSLPVNVRRWSTTFVGLGCIPFIVKPIDHSVDYMMNSSVRKMYVAKPEPSGVFHHERDD